MYNTTDAVVALEQLNINDPLNSSIRSRTEKMTCRIYFRTFWMDYLLLAILGAIAFSITKLPTPANHVFPIYFGDAEIVNPEFGYPFRKNIIPTWLSGLLAFIIPFILIMLMQIRIRSFNDVNTATMGLILALISAAFFQAIIKWLIGGLRPHFLSACKPNINGASASTGQNFDNLMFDQSICIGDKKEVHYALQSMPSGHATAAFASLVYCSLYLNGKLKIFANYRPQYWKITLFYASLLGAVLLAATLLLDFYHHWYDILAGSIIGTIVAVGSYGCHYTSILDYRFNHIPLPRIEADQGFDYHLDHLETSLTGSKKGGWNNGYIYGAPFDATYQRSI